MTRDLALAGVQKWGYNPVLCNWDAWAGHWKPKCVGKPHILSAKDVSSKLVEAVEGDFDPSTKLVDLRWNVKPAKPEMSVK